MRNILALASIFILMTTSVNAATLVNYPFTGDTNYTVLGPGVDSSSFDGSALGNYYIAGDGYGPVLQAYPSADSTDYNSALANNSYFTITLSAVSGQTLGLGTLAFEVGKGGDSDPRGYFIRTSVDSYASDLFSTLLPTGDQQAPALETIDLSSFQDVSSIGFRFYVFTPEPDYNSVDFRNLVISSSAVPEPSTFALLGLGLGGLAFWKRRQRRA